MSSIEYSLHSIKNNTNLRVNPLHAVVVGLVWWNIQLGFPPRHATQQINIMRVKITYTHKYK